MHRALLRALLSGLRKHGKALRRRLLVEKLRIGLLALYLRAAMFLGLLIFCAELQSGVCAVLHAAGGNRFIKLLKFRIPGRKHAARPAAADENMLRNGGKTQYSLGGFLRRLRRLLAHLRRGRCCFKGNFHRAVFGAFLIAFNAAAKQKGSRKRRQKQRRRSLCRNLPHFKTPPSLFLHALGHREVAKNAASVGILRRCSCVHVLFLFSPQKL